MQKINTDLLDQISNQAKNNKRKRMNFNFHKNMEENLHRMLNAIEPGSYIQPHKHENPDKSEAFIVLRGKFLSVTFDDEGNITNHLILSQESGNFGVDIKAGIWHTIISLESGSVLYEVKDGPYNKSTDKNFAKWAPEEGNPEAKQYLDNIVSKLI